MRFDIENQLSVNQAFTQATGAEVSEHSYKKQTASQDLSIGRRMALLVLPTVAAAAGATDVTIEAIQADDAALTTNVEALSSVTVAASAFALGKEIEVPIPQGVMSRLYLGARVTVVGAGGTASADIYLVPQDEIAKYKSFPKVNDVAI